MIPGVAIASLGGYLTLHVVRGTRTLCRQLVVGVRVVRFELDVRRRNLIRFGPNLGSARCGKCRNSPGFRVG